MDMQMYRLYKHDFGYEVCIDIGYSKWYLPRRKHVGNWKSRSSVISSKLWLAIPLPYWILDTEKWSEKSEFIHFYHHYIS